MTPNRIRIAVVLGAIIVTLSVATRAESQGMATFDEAAAPGNNYDKAEFRLWLPRDAGRLQGVVVLVPGSNGDGRLMVDETIWQGFATRHRLALLGCRFVDKPHDQSFIEHYVHAPDGSGQALLDALVVFARRSDHPELVSAPLLLWGFSAGGQFNYEFVAWKPERVIAFVVNKGGIYYSALLSRAARGVPGVLFVGEKDLDFRTHTIVGLFAVNRRGGALWALAEEPGVAHFVGRSLEMTLRFFEDVLPLRLPAEAAPQGEPGSLRALTEGSGFIGDLKAKTFKQAEASAPSFPTSWLPTERVARAWEALVTRKPFDP